MRINSDCSGGKRALALSPLHRNWAREKGPQLSISPISIYVLVDCALYSFPVCCGHIFVPFMALCVIFVIPRGRCIVQNTGFSLTKMTLMFTNVLGLPSLTRPVSNSVPQARPRNLVLFSTFVRVLGGGTCKIRTN